MYQLLAYPATPTGEYTHWTSIKAGLPDMTRKKILEIHSNIK